jgi:sarcosine oxidase
LFYEKDEKGSTFVILLDIDMKVIVIGRGIVGLSVIYELEKAGHDVLSIYSSPAEASGGKTRIFRVFHQDPRLEEDAKRASQLWSFWEDEFGSHLIKRTGLYLQGGWSKDAGYSETRWQHPLFAKEGLCAFDPDAGIGKIAKTMSLLEEKISASKKKAKVIDAKDGVVTLSSGEILEADFIVVAAGYETRDILSRPKGRIMHHLRFLFPYKDSNTRKEWQKIPALIDKDLSLYGVAEKKGFALGLTSDQELGFTKAQSYDEIRRKRLFISGKEEEARKIVQSYFPSLLPDSSDMIYCLRDEKESDGYELERGHKFLGITGNNLFKFAPLLGSLAKEALERES